MKIVDIKASTVSMPLEAPIRHSSGAHWGRFLRTIVEIETDEGITGFGELGGGGESAESAVVNLKQYLIGHDPFNLEKMKFMICNPTASLYNNRTQIFAAIEFACLDIIGKYLNQPIYQLFGGKVRDEVKFASYLFFRHENDLTKKGRIETSRELIAHAKNLKKVHGFTSHKLKGGVFSPQYELGVYQELAAAFPEDSFRYDPNSVLSIEDSIWFAKNISHIKNDYFEDPTWGLQGMKLIREKTNMLLATNTVVVNFEQLAQNIVNRSCDVILLDTTFWGGLRSCIKAAQICEAFQLPIAVHSSGELGIQLATMLHLGAVVPNLSFAADAHYHHLTDDIIKGPMFKYVNGKIKVPDLPGLGIEIDRDKLNHYRDEFKRLGAYPYDRDPKRPGWFPMIPNDDWAIPVENRT